MSGSFAQAFDAYIQSVKALLIILLVLVPFAAWKITEIVVWVLDHVSLVVT